MPIRREFSDWSQPALPAAADWLLRRYSVERRCDLREVIVAMPGGRAGRRLLEALADRAERSDRELIPPRVLTLGELPELLYDAKKPFANDLTQHLAWIAALQGIPPREP